MRKLREAEIELAQGQSIKAVCKKLQITDQAYYRWQKECLMIRVARGVGGLGEWSGGGSKLAARTQGAELHVPLDLRGMRRLAVPWQAAA